MRVGYLVCAVILAAGGCGPLAGLRTAREVNAVYTEYEADIRSLNRLERQGATPAIKAAARDYRLALFSRSAALVVDSAIDFSAGHGGVQHDQLKGLDSLFANQEVARSKLLLASTAAATPQRNAALMCLREYGQCTEQREDTAMACNSRLLSCLADGSSDASPGRALQPL